MTRLGRLLSIDQLAAIWGEGWTATRIRRLVRRREIPFVKVGGRICFREEELARWLDARVEGPATNARRVDRTREEECAALGIPVDHRYA
jgi:excisionase family DNA binding protein